MARRRVLITLDQETIALLEALTTPRKKGEYVTELIHQAARGEQAPALALLRRMDERLGRMEELLEQLLHASGYSDRENRDGPIRSQPARL